MPPRLFSVFSLFRRTFAYRSLCRPMLRTCLWRCTYTFGSTLENQGPWLKWTPRLKPARLFVSSYRTTSFWKGKGLRPILILNLWYLHELVYLAELRGFSPFYWFRPIQNTLKSLCWIKVSQLTTARFVKFRFLSAVLNFTKRTVKHGRCVCSTPP